MSEVAKNGQNYLKQNNHKTKRSSTLIADFADGYASGWCFAIHEGFRDALDIKWTRRQKNKVVSYIWTQGNEFNFLPGYIIYDTRKAYELNWMDALKHIRVYVQIIDSIPGYTVKFSIYRPNKLKTSVEEVDVIECLQESFVKMLRTGNIDLFNGTTINIFGEYARDVDA